jgi:rubrerythrin
MCKYCKDFNEEKNDMEIYEIDIIGVGYFFYDCPIRYCPACGKILDKYKDKL